MKRITLAFIVALTMLSAPAFAGEGKAHNPCGHANPCAMGENPCAANPCAAKNPCAKTSNPCAVNPCAAKNPCATKNPCSKKGH